MSFFFSQNTVVKDKVFIFIYFDFIEIFFSEDVILVPLEPPANEQQGQPFYHPPPPPMGYPPPPPMGYPPPMGNPYAVPPQNYEGNFNPYPQQNQMPYPPQQQPFNPYQVKEGKREGFQ